MQTLNSGFNNTLPNTPYINWEKGLYDKPPNYFDFSKNKDRINVAKNPTNWFSSSNYTSLNQNSNERKNKRKTCFSNSSNNPQINNRKRRITQRQFIQNKAVNQNKKPLFEKIKLDGYIQNTNVDNQRQVHGRTRKRRKNNMQTTLFQSTDTDVSFVNPNKKTRVAQKKERNNQVPKGFHIVNEDNPEYFDSSELVPIDISSYTNTNKLVPLTKKKTTPFTISKNSIKELFTNYNNRPQITFNPSLHSVDNSLAIVPYRPKFPESNKQIVRSNFVQMPSHMPSHMPEKTISGFTQGRIYSLPDDDMCSPSNSYDSCVMIL